MTIRKGHEWGTLAIPDPNMMTVSSDAELHALVASRDADDSAVSARTQAIGLLGGDLMRTLGGAADRDRFTGAAPIPHLPVDVVRVTVDDARTTVVVAHLVVRRSWWRGPITALMNAQFLGTWDVSPRCHPNDGRVDVVHAAADLTVQQRWMARSRLGLGTHVPHPLITIKQQSSVTLDLGVSTPLWVDGERWGSGRHIVATVEPDAYVVCV